MTSLPDTVKDWLGKPVIVMDHVLTVEQGLWANFCVAIEDANPLYWDYRLAREETETVIAPPMMLPSWAIDHDWRPEREGPAPRTLELHFMVKDALGYKNGLVTEVELELHEPLRAGDSVKAELTNVRLTNEWKRYEISLTDKDLSRIKTGFGWRLTAQGEPITFFLDDIRYIN